MNVRHKVTQIADKTWCISEFGLVNAFLAEGNESAALIDTGCGIGDMGATVKAWTDKPVMVLLTHAHPDHTGGMYTLPKEQVYLHPADGYLNEHMLEFTHQSFNDMRKMYVETRVPVRFPGEGHVEALLQLIPEKEPDNDFFWSPLEQGQVMDLGGRTLTVIHTPGHSDGSVCFLDEKNRVLFSGDTVNKQIILMRQLENDKKLIQVYHDTVERLWKLSEQYDCLAIGHDGVTIPKDIVRDYLDLTAGLLDGGITGSYEERGVRKGDVARLGAAELWYQCDA